MKRSGVFSLFMIIVVLVFFSQGCKKNDDNSNSNQIWSADTKAYVQEIVAIQGQADQNLKTWSKSMDSLSAIEKLHQFFLSNPNVSYAVVTDQGIDVEYKNGIRGGIVLNTQDSGYITGNSLKLCPDVTNEGSEVKSAASNKKMILIEAAYDEFKLFTDNTIRQHSANLPKVNYDFVFFKGDEATLERYTRLSGYGIIELASHGFNWSGPKGECTDIYMETGDTLHTDMQYLEDLSNQNIIIPYHDKKTRYWIRDKFITSHNDFSNDTILFYGSFCYSNRGTWPSIQKTFANGVYVGYDFAVKAQWDSKWAINLIYFLSDTTKHPLKDIKDWMQDSAISKYYYDPDYPRKYNPLRIAMTGDSTLTLLPDTSTMVKDIDGNVYHTKKIGSQVWTIENLKTTRLNDGTAIELVTDDNSWSSKSTGAYCFFDNDASNKSDYGALYNWYAAGSNKLAPKGWHIPTLDEWTTLINYLGGSEVAGGKLKEVGLAHWSSPNAEATNSSGFTALPGGYRYIEGQFVNMHSFGYWWTSTTYDNENAYYIDMRRDYGSTESQIIVEGSGFSVKCIKN